jgi:hypothetical protein
LAKCLDARTLFALNMQRVRSEQGISQGNLAQLAGLHPIYISSAGKFPGMSLHAAGEAYHRAAIAISEGHDPAAERAKLQQAECEAMTVKALCTSFIERYAKLHKRTWREPSTSQSVT